MRSVGISYFPPPPTASHPHLIPPHPPPTIMSFPKGFQERSPPSEKENQESSRSPSPKSMNQYFELCVDNNPPSLPSPTTPTTTKAAWIQRLDESSNNFYYENLSTLEKTWQAPSDRYFVPFSPARDKGGAFQISTSNAPQGLVERANHGGRRRRRSSALAFHLAWSEQQDENGATYFFNKMTKAVQWDFPPEWPIPPVDNAWEERTDADSKAKFFYNRVNQVTQWTLPEAMR